MTIQEFNLIVTILPSKKRVKYEISRYSTEKLREVHELKVAELVEEDSHKIQCRKCDDQVKINLFWANKKVQIPDSIQDESKIELKSEVIEEILVPEMNLDIKPEIYIKEEVFEQEKGHGNEISLKSSPESIENRKKPKNCDRSKYYTNIKCKLCSKEIRRYNMKKHILTHSRRGKGDFQCNECGNSYTRLSTLENHLIVTHFPLLAKFSCEICSKNFTRLLLLNRHKEIQHQIDGNSSQSIQSEHELKKDCYKCGECSTTFHRKRNYDRHVNTFQCRKERKKYNYAQKTLCHICSKEVNTNILKYHLAAHASGQKQPYECNECGRKFTRPLTVLDHLIHKHFQSLAKFSCELCPKVFARLPILNQHKVATHRIGENLSQKCPHCNLILANKSTLKTHINDMHTDPALKKKFTCEQCSKIFFKKDNYKIHVLTHVSQDKWPFHCEICEKAFIKKGVYDKHKKEHLDLESILKKCEVCGKGFKYRNSLVEHMYIHTENSI
uniref:CSON005095 protein n=1 Tax=Culicoides sonorensis TaxID=179676 RepID=A0A336LUF7_CULSO